MHKNLIGIFTILLYFFSADFTLASNTEKIDSYKISQSKQSAQKPLPAAPLPFRGASSAPFRLSQSPQTQQPQFPIEEDAENVDIDDIEEEVEEENDESEEEFLRQLSQELGIDPQMLGISPQTAPQKQAPTPSVPQKTKPAAPPVKRADIRFNFDDADIFEVIQTVFGEILKANYIVDPKVKGRVTFRTVSPVAKEDVLPLMEVILRLNGIGIVEESGLYRIVSLGDVPREPAPVGLGRDPEMIQITGKALLQVVPIQYMQSSEMVKILTPFLSTTAVIVDVPKSNYIVIVDTDTNIKRLLKLVERFDSEQIGKIRLKVFVYPVQNSKAKDIADMLKQIFLGEKPAVKTPAPPARTHPAQPQPTPAPLPLPQSATGQTGGEALVSEMTKIFPDETRNSIIILATPEDYAIISETIQKIDIAPRQVLIEGLIVSVRLSDDMSFGIAWSLKSDINFSMKPFNKDINLGGTMGAVNTIDPETGLAKGLGTGFTFVGADAAGNVRARLEALASEGKGKVMAAPHILVSDNQEARIQVGQQIPIVTSETKPAAGDTKDIVRTVQYKDIGIILKVKPQVNDSGLVNLEISQEISSVAAKDVGGEVAIDKTETTTTLVAQDGQTIIIGGLMREDATKSRSGIPFLSKIPILGYLFGSTTITDTKTELVILLTPHVVRNQQDAKNVTSDYVDRFKDSTKDKKINKYIKNKGKKEHPGDKDLDKDLKEAEPTPQQPVQ